MRIDLFRYADSLHYSIVNLHMKCCDSGLNRRKNASQMLYDYIKNKKEHSPEGHHSTSSIIIREILTRKKKRFYFENQV